MVNVFDASSLSSKHMRQWLRYNQIAHYLMSRSDFEIKIVQKIKCLICISKGSLLLKHPVYTLRRLDYVSPTPFSGPPLAALGSSHQSFFG